LITWSESAEAGFRQSKTEYEIVLN